MARRSGRLSSKPQEKPHDLPSQRPPGPHRFPYPSDRLLRPPYGRPAGRPLHRNAPHTAIAPHAPHPEAAAPEFYSLRLIALGHPHAVDNCRLRLHKLGYADPNDWSIPLPIIRSTEVIRAAKPGEIMRILTKRVAPPAIA